MRSRLTALLFAAMATTSYASDQIPGAPQTEPIALIGATVHTVSNGTLSDATVLFENGIISAVGHSVQVPDEALRLDLSGKHVYPGLIDGASIMGLQEVGAVRASNDHREVGDVTPEVHAARALNPDSQHLPVTRASGITATLSVPTGGLVAGMAALIQLDGWTSEDLVIRSPAALVVNWPQMRIDRRPQAKPGVDVQIGRRAEQIQRLRDLFAEARAYRKASSGRDLRLQALQPVLDGQIPVLVQTSDLRQVQAALDWSQDEGVDLIIVGNGDIWRVADELARRQVPVIYGSTYLLPARADDAYDAAYTAPARLHEAGVSFALANSLFLGQTRYLSEIAGRAVAYGLPADAALRAITLEPARIFGVADRLGSIEVGKEATLIVTDGDILEVVTDVELEFIGGRAVDLSSHHTQLYDKYRIKYERLGLLGTTP